MNTSFETLQEELEALKEMSEPEVIERYQVDDKGEARGIIIDWWYLESGGKNELYFDYIKRIKETL
ncbi:MAG: hypothetical protein LBL07_03830 [Tannerella sp.]|jgi:hypothetical protein|nr:hypothetical protein [Tannerella sp.]